MRFSKNSMPALSAAAFCACDTANGSAMAIQRNRAARGMVALEFKRWKGGLGALSKDIGNRRRRTGFGRGRRRRVRMMQTFPIVEGRRPLRAVLPRLGRD